MSQQDYKLLSALRYALRRFLRFSENAARAAGLSPQQHQALLAIKGHSENATITIGQLAERLQIRHHSAVGLANRLVSHSLAVRRPGTTDRRQVGLTLTPRGEAVLEKLSSAHRQQIRKVGPAIKTVLDRLTA